MDNTAQTLRHFIVENFLFGQPATFSDDDSFLDLSIIDSTGVLELVTFLESHYQIHIADEDLVPENLDSINNLVRFLRTKVPGSRSPVAGGSLPLADIPAPADSTPCPQ